MNTKRSLMALAIGLVSMGATAQELQELDLTQIAGEVDEQSDVITSEMIENRMVSDVSDLVKDIPGVEIEAADTRWGDMGFNIRGVTDDRVAITVDGLTQGETLQYEGGQAYGYFKGGRGAIDLETMKLVDITRGADSVISGSGALGGSVRFVTKDADDFLAQAGDDVGGKVAAMYADASDQTMLNLSAAARAGQFEALAIVTGREASETSNHTEGADVQGSARERPDPQDKDISNLFVKLNYDFSDKHVLGLVVERYEAEIETDAKSFDGRWYLDRIGDDTRKRERIGVFHELQADAVVFDELSWAFNYQTSDFQAITRQNVTFYDDPDTPERELAPRIDTRDYDQTMRQLRVDFAKGIVTGSVQHDLVYGFAWLDHGVENTQVRWQNSPGRGPSTSVVPALIPQADIESANVYVLDKIQLGERTELQVGLRYDDYDYSAKATEFFEDSLGGTSLGDQSFDAVSGALGITQKITDTLSIGANVGRGFRAPTIENLYTRSGTEDDWATGPNPDLDVETATNYELSLSGLYSAGQFNVTVFYSDYEDFIDYSQRSRINEAGEIDLYDVPDNVGDVELKGVELTAVLDLHEAFAVPEGLSTRFSASYAEGEKDNGYPLTSVQPASARWTMAYNAPQGHWGVEANVDYTAGKDADDAYFINSRGELEYREYLSRTATVVNVIAFYNFTDQLSLRAGLFNLTDKEYYTWDGIRFVGTDDLRPGIGVTGNGISRYTEPGRNFNVRLDYRF
ncbi:MAG: membrane receptor protein [Gammaproteobacteria bacterium]|nr:MAG: membrane receptor protein [Gammaproteobacteria bacterium]